MGTKFLPILVCVFFVWSFAQSQTTREEENDAPVQYFYSTQACIEDLVYLNNKLQDAHPCLYCYTDSTSINQAFTTLISQLQSGDSLNNQEITEEAFTLLVKEYVALYKDGHLDASNYPALFRYIRQGGKFFPLQLLFENGKVYIKHDYSEYLSVTTPTELIAINDIPVSTILADIHKSTSADADIQLYKTRQLENPEKLGIALWLLYGPAASYKVTYAEDNTLPKTAVFDGITAKEIIKINEQLPTKPLLQISDSSSVAYLDINSFEGVFAKQEVVYLWKFLENSFRKINEHNTETLIIDLRDNPGGMIYNAHLLLNYISPQNIESAFQVKSSNLLKAHKKHGLKGFFQRNFDKKSYAAKIAHTPIGRFIPFSSKAHFVANEKLKFKGKVILLVNGNTFSAAGLFTKYFKENNLGLVAGEECGASPSFSFGNTVLVDLPNTDVQVYLPTAIVANDAIHNYQSHGIQPDVPLQRNLVQEINNEDSVLEQVYQLVKQHNSQFISSKGE